MSAVLELLLADSRTPTGGYAHSGGLEAAVGAGLQTTAIPAFIKARLQTVGFLDAAFAARAAGTIELSALLELDDELAARTPAEPTRAAARRLGLALLRCGLAWFPEHPLLRGYRGHSITTPRPVALGLLSQVVRIAPLACARLCLYDDAAGVAAAAVKLAALDGATASGWLIDLAPLIERLAQEATAAAQLPRATTPLLDHRALHHALDRRRLFAS
jgi:urease accessory protein